MLRLCVREITSVSATFILSSRLDSSIDPPLSSLGFSHDSDDDLALNAPPTVSSSLIADALSKGLSVTVNGSAWPRAFIRIDEQIDEAVIIIYALLPGRQYDILLGLAACQDVQSEQQIQHQEQPIGNGSATRTLIITPEITTNEIVDDPNSPSFEDELSSSLSSSSSSSLSTPSSSTPPSSSPFITPLPPPSHPPPPTTPPQPTLTDHLTQLHQTLTHLTTERDTLLSSLKSLRRESQKADASLRAEIDTLKRTFDKNASFEVRSKQKLLALQESVKRAQNAARESQEMTSEVEGEIMDLMIMKEEKEYEYERAEDDAGKVKCKREDVEEKERKRVDGMRAELNALTNKLERLNGKRDRMDGVLIPDLEVRVQNVESEIEDAEREVLDLEREEQIRLQLEETYLQHLHNYHYQLQQDNAQQSPLWAAAAATTTTCPSTTRPTQSCSTLAHNPRSQSMHSPPVTYSVPHRQASLKNTSKSKSMSLSTSTTSTGSPPSSSSIFLADLQQQAQQHPSPTSSSTRSSPGGSAMNKCPSKLLLATGAGGSYPTTPNLAVDPLAVGAGRPCRRLSEATIWPGKNAE